MKNSQRIRTHALRGAALAAAYFATAMLGSLSVPPQAADAAVWPAAGVGLAGLFGLGPAYWPAVALASFAASVAAGVPALPAAAAPPRR